MKQFKLRVFIDYKKEIEWINKLASQGISLISCKQFVYVFEKSEPGEFIYSIELFRNMPTQPEGKDYIKFLKECGIECISSIYGWGYLRKKAIDGSFDLFSDIQSVLSYKKRLRKNYTVGILYLLFITFLIRNWLFEKSIISSVLSVILILLFINFSSEPLMTKVTSF